jgi:hypothetical protein
VAAMTLAKEAWILMPLSTKSDALRTFYWRECDPLPTIGAALGMTIGQAVYVFKKVTGV